MGWKYSVSERLVRKDCNGSLNKLSKCLMALGVSVTIAKCLLHNIVFCHESSIYSILTNWLRDMEQCRTVFATDSTRQIALFRAPQPYKLSFREQVLTLHLSNQYARAHC
jgi:hypothetical protein